MEWNENLFVLFISTAEYICVKGIKRNTPNKNNNRKNNTNANNETAMDCGNFFPPANFIAY